MLWLGSLVFGAAVVGIPSCGAESSSHPKVIVVGFDGMDPRLCERLMDAGQLPNLDKLRRIGGYSPLQTTIPPQSPVAWATFITGANPGVHGIFDFIHRDPSQQVMPYYSAAETQKSDEGWRVGPYRIPLTFWPFNHRSTQTVLRRGGKPFWDYLDEAGVPTWIYEIPANYPPSPSRQGHVHCLSGMGVPDLLGGYGTYQFFSTETIAPKREGGGLRKPLVFENDEATAVLIGPDNTLLKTPKPTKVRFKIFRRPTGGLQDGSAAAALRSAARIELQDQTIVLNEGEWSDWCKVDFELEMPSFLPNRHIHGICRFFLQQVRPVFRLYVSPLNIDPSEPGDQSITEPRDFIEEIADKLGLFYTTGFQEDHKALSNRVFSDADYKTQADYVLKERLNLRDYALDRYEDGLLFFYFSSTDLQAHMFWWDSDEKHPVRSAENAKKYNGVIVDLYRRMDAVVGDILNRFDGDATILVMSDHGFCNFRRQFNLNSWLRAHGYLFPRDCKSLLNPRRGKLVEWNRTRAYGLGLNGLYLNLLGRERDGIVFPSERDALLNEITQKLLAVKDPLNGQPVVARVYRSDEVYSGPLVGSAPDLIVGYNRGYRASWATTLGDLTDKVLTDNDSAWSADHCIAAELVPGVIFSNKPIVKSDPSLLDLAPTILEAFGLTPPPAMEGRSLFRSRAAARAKTGESVAGVR